MKVTRQSLLIFLMFCLPVDQVFSFSMPVCVLPMGGGDHRAHEVLNPQEEASQKPACGHQDSLDCTIFSHCHFFTAWAFMPFVALAQVSPISFVIPFNVSARAQFDPDGLEHPPRTLLP